MRQKVEILATILIMLLITGCSSVNKEEAIETAKVAFEEGVVSDAKEPNEESGLFRFYLPHALTLEEKTDNNLILSKGQQLFLVFSNPAEDRSSRVNFEQDKIVEEKAILIETKEIEGMFSYVIISPFEDNEYKVIVGIGGEKGTTITRKANFRESVETLLQIVHSISY